MTAAASDGAMRERGVDEARARQTDGVRTDPGVMTQGQF